MSPCRSSDRAPLHIPYTKNPLSQEQSKWHGFIYLIHTPALQNAIEPTLYMLSDYSLGGGEDRGARMLTANIFAQRLLGVNRFSSPTSLYFKTNFF